MKTNHREGTQKRRDRHRFSPSESVKEEARSNRRNIEDKICSDIRSGRLDPEDAVLPTRPQEVSDTWNWD